MLPHWFQEAVLHDHGDGSVTLLNILPQLFRISGRPFPFSIEPEIMAREVREWFTSGRDIVERFSVTTGVLQSYEALYLFGKNYVCRRASEGYEYCEMTIAPQYHTFSGLTEAEVVAAVIEGIKSGESIHPRAEVNLLFSIGREASPEKAVRLVNVAGRCDRDYVVGIGLVCDEAAHPPEKHVPMFRRAKALGFKTTCHAGEWVCEPGQQADFHRDLPGLIKNIRTAVFGLGADRIGHAIGLPYDPELMKVVVDRQIGVEGCPGSNFASGLIPDTKCLRIREMLEAGVLYSLNPDDDLFLPTLAETFQLCDREYRLTADEKMALRLNALLTKFGNRKLHEFTVI